MSSFPVTIAAALLAIGVHCWPAPADARVVELTVEERSPVLAGSVFGGAGAYEKLRGTVRFAFDPENAANARVTDLALAPIGPSGGGEAMANFMVLRPLDPGAASGIGMLEVSNRGGKASLRYFNAASEFAADPVEPEHFGDGLLMRLGLTLIWVGWQFDVPDSPGNLRLLVPSATMPGGPITGLVRSDWVVDEPITELALAHRDHIPYRATDTLDDRNILYVRDGRDTPRRMVPRGQRHFGDRGETIVMERGFSPGRIYELVYVSQDPPLVGLGLAAVRDMMSFAKYDPRSPFPVQQGIAFGVSQTGRFLRHFLYQGFNVDEDGRKVYDGMLIHTAGAGRGSFNHRFAQPSRDAHRFSAFFFPTDLYPFASMPTHDPVTGRTDGLLDSLSPEFRPRIMVTNTGYEYWGRAASLVHTTPDGAKDAETADGERIYHLASAQHFVGRWPPTEDRRIADADGWIGNPMNLLLNLRALMSRLVAWVAEDRPPPESRYPRIADGDLVPVDALAFPAIPGVRPPAEPHLAYRADYGPRWSEGIIDRQPPWLGPPFQTLVPQVDSVGNEIGGVRNAEIVVPLATYTPWSLRWGMLQAAEMRDFRGTLLPLPWTRVEAEARGDPRPAVEELYPDYDHYMIAVGEAADRLVAAGFLLQEDRARVISRASDLWQRLAGRAGADQP